ncbi:SusD-like starch-binding protein associating with outer membrane [Sphingobacterium sp. JUb20]|nr:SusD-like starch-binding protein associating with outer membrane [Sphingobacterium sp. JUb20]
MIAGIAYPYPAKYKNYNSLPTNEYAVVFRLSEVYLMKAEALIALNVCQQAQDNINQIRKRAGLMDIQSLDPIVLREALIKEWRSEYFAEWGHRWFDLKRWGLIDQVLTDSKPNWKATAQWLPIPLSEIQTNIFLIQNPGYDD